MRVKRGISTGKGGEKRPFISEGLHSKKLSQSEAGKDPSEGLLVQT
ncbi:hypothetical protein GCWU000341_01215 [Oribacterium sp. oral taxon 078 str. F0262]|nr:hypothetical protein GCWU000341_01215 [Oribacterium sp. oral taxon 078 str. F0262]